MKAILILLPLLIASSVAQGQTTLVGEFMRQIDNRCPSPMLAGSVPNSLMVFKQETESVNFDYRRAFRLARESASDLQVRLMVMSGNRPVVFIASETEGAG